MKQFGMSFALMLFLILMHLFIFRNAICVLAIRRDVQNSRLEKKYRGCHWPLNEIFNYTSQNQNREEACFDVFE